MLVLIVCEAVASDGRHLLGHVVGQGSEVPEGPGADGVCRARAARMHPEWAGGVVAAVDADGYVRARAPIPAAAELAPKRKAKRR